MEKIARFEHVSYEQYEKDTPGADRKQYEEIPLPLRATAGSAGYDFFMPYDITLLPHKTARVSTGIRSKIAEGWVLMIYPRSSLGFKYKLQLDNTVGIIDSDYYGADNEGHIMIKVTNNGEKTLELKKGDRFAQGVFLPFGITEDDAAAEKRTGGFGSTNTEATIEKRCNPTTGYNWFIINDSEETVQVTAEYIPSSAKGLVGAGGKTVFTFRARKAGAGSVTLEYRRPFEKEAIERCVVHYEADENKGIRIYE